MLAEMVARGGGPISHKLRNNGTEDRQRFQTTEGTGRLGDGDEGNSKREDRDNGDNDGEEMKNRP